MAPRDAILALQAAMNAEVLGQPRVIERMVLGLLADGHLLIEGLPGLAKTRAVKAMAHHLKADFSRIQFTPDLLPSDVTGTDIYYSDGGKGEFRFQPGPVFGNILLADEINRAPAKVQAALLEAMEERQVTVGQDTHPLPDLFMVLATQNPIEQEGTYPLPEAQTDRFLMKVLVEYPAPADELAVIRLVRGEEQAAAAPPATDAGPAPPTDQPNVFTARREIAGLHVAEAIETYIVDLVNATRQPARPSPDLGRQIEFGASPWAGLALDRCGRALAWLNGQDFVSPGDIQAVAPGRAAPPGRPLLRGQGRRAQRRRRARRPRQAGRGDPMAGAAPADPRIHVGIDRLAALEHRARGFDFLPRQPVGSVLSGRRASRVRGLEFEEIRAYLPGDDVRAIDWKVTARTGAPHVRVTREERDRPALLLVDQRQAMFFGTRLNMKSVTAAEVAAVAAWRILGAGDRVGGMVFADAVSTGSAPAAPAPPCCACSASSPPATPPSPPPPPSSPRRPRSSTGR